MINRIGAENRTEKNSNFTKRQMKQAQTPSFKGVGSLLLAGLQKCEQMPMVNVAVVDMLSAILPRTIVETMTNWFAGFEAFRRESSGLFVNCIIPSFITLGIAKCLNPIFMPKGANMSGCWADRDLIQKSAELYEKSSSENKIEESLNKLLGGLEGVDGKDRIIFKDKLGEAGVKNYSKRLYELSKNNISDKEMYEEVEKIAQEIVKKTKVSENIKLDNVNASSVESMLKDSVKFFKEFQKSDGKITMTEFAKKNKKLVRTKSLMGLAVVLPLAASMQYINRWITGKISGTKGAPIYDDFGKGNNIEQNLDAKKGLLKQKLISISSMIGVSLLSMTKLPSWKMLDFKGIFPTMDQARIISTTTFASRMAAADDKNELAEATVRDIATFASLYYLGDVASKAAATIIQKRTGVTLLNDMKPLKKDANILQKFKHWMKDINVKSSHEVVSKTEQMLNGAKPTEAQLKQIEKEIKHAVNLRSYCQVANLGVSLALLGLVIPIFTRRNTKRKHEQALKLAQEQNAVNEKSPQVEQENVTPLNVKYTKMTAGFRAEKRQKTA